MIAWAHGTSGVARQCAPSLRKDLYYGDYIKTLLGQGYAVVAADYSGLGAGDKHEYVSMPANANDVRHSVAASHQAVALSPATPITSSFTVPIQRTPGTGLYVPYLARAPDVRFPDFNPADVLTDTVCATTPNTLRAAATTCPWP